MQRKSWGELGELLRIAASSNLLIELPPYPVPPTSNIDATPGIESPQLVKDIRFNWSPQADACSAAGLRR